MKKLEPILIFLAILIVAVFYLLSHSVSRKDVSDYKNATYQIGTRYFGYDSKGDLNGDGVEDVAFLLTEDNGGSGTFYYVVVALGTDTGYVGTNAIILGDRIAPQSTEIQNDEVIVNYADRLPTDPMTAQPSVGVSRYFRITDGKLIEDTL